MMVIKDLREKCNKVLHISTQRSLRAFSLIQIRATFLELYNKNLTLFQMNLFYHAKLGFVVFHTLKI